MVHNPHVFTEEEALMCTEGSDKLKGTKRHGYSLRAGNYGGTQFRFVALEWAGKCLHACLRVAQGKCQWNITAVMLLMYNLTCFLFLFRHRLCSPAAWPVLRGPNHVSCHCSLISLLPFKSENTTHQSSQQSLGQDSRLGNAPKSTFTSIFHAPFPSLSESLNQHNKSNTKNVNNVSKYPSKTALPGSM